MIKNRISIRNIIAKVLADNDMQEDTLRVNDLIEWSAEALLRIGAFLELDTTVTGKGEEPLLELADYQTALPSDLHSIIQVGISLNESGPFHPMRETSGSFDSVRGITIEDTDDDDEDTTTYTTRAENMGTDTFTTDVVYSIKPGYLVSNIQEGYLMLAYRSIPLDDEGYPYVPDDPGFEDAIYWYLTMKMLYPKWVMGKVRDAVYYNARMSWNYYSKQAYGNSMMPDADMLESIQNTWTRLIPELGDHSNFFATTGDKQQIYNQTNRNYATSSNSGVKRWV